MQILSLILGDQWPVERVHTWFQHRAQNSVAKYSSVEVKEEDKELWHKVELIWSMSTEEKLAISIAQCKVRAANYLENFKEKWIAEDFCIKGKQLNTLSNLQLAYENDYDGDSDQEIIENQFGIELPTIPKVNNSYDIKKVISKAHVQLKLVNLT